MDDEEMETNRDEIMFPNILEENSHSVGLVEEERTRNQIQNAGNYAEMQAVDTAAERQQANNEVSRLREDHNRIAEPTLDHLQQPSPPPSPKKRKRSKSSEKQEEILNTTSSSDVENGSVCPICLDQWDIIGDHRICSLKCGHLFGHSCIMRWIKGCAAGAKCCPFCKTKALKRDVRFIYAKKVCAIDNTEEHKLRELLEKERIMNTKLSTELSILKLELATTKSLLSQMEVDIKRFKRGGIIADSTSTQPSLQYRLCLEKNIQICREPGCRVMHFGQNSKKLVVSQKSYQSLFPGYGVRIIDVNTFKPMNFLHVSAKSVRDLSYNVTEDLLVSATMEKSAKLFDVHNKNVVNVFSPCENPLWACDMDKKNANFLYLGAQHGSVYLYDVRNARTFVTEFKEADDLSPVISVCPVHNSTIFPYGGLLVCTLHSVWFYEYLASQETVSTKLGVEGPFISLSYNVNTNTVLVCTRPTNKCIHSRYIVGDLTRIGNLITLDIKVTFLGSRVTPIMSRCTQIPVEDNTLIAAYLQDVKILSVWNVAEQNRIKEFPIKDIVFDTCSIFDRDKTFFAALTETKCSIYKNISLNE